MEMNTRLQVEHPVTEMAVGVDLVKLQLDVAAGLPLDWDQNEVSFDRHAVEVRVYAEDPARGFLPSSGRVLVLHEPELARGDGDTEVRVDSGLVPGYEVGTGCDPMLAKIVACARDRETALHALRQALTRTTVLGVRTNIGFLHRLLADDDVAAGRLDTGLVEAVQDRISGTGLPPGAVALAALVGQAGLEPKPDADGWVDPFSVPTGWRIGTPHPPSTSSASTAATPSRFACTGADGTPRSPSPGSPPSPRTWRSTAPDTARLTFGGLTETYRHACADDGSLGCRAAPTLAGGAVRPGRGVGRARRRGRRRQRWSRRCPAPSRW
ncbi:ATP-binding protein [Yinghuangia aomiensis]